MKRNIWIYFILLQPFLDVATNFILKNFDFPITIGVVVRMLFLALAFVFAMNHFIQHKEKKLLLLNLAVYAYLAVNFIVNFIWKDSFSFMAEAEFLAKTAYPVQLFFVFYILVKNKWLTKEKIVQLLTINLLAISAFIILPTLFNISFESYNEFYEGTIGWFNAANEIGAIVAFLTPLAIWGMYKKLTGWLGIATVFASVYTAYLIGTKVSLGSVILVLVIFSIYILARNRFRLSKPFFIVFLPLIVLLISLNQAPAVQNIENVRADLEAREQRFENREEIYDREQVQKLEEIERLKELSHPTITKIVSSRDLFVIQHYEKYVDADPARIALGMGYAADYDFEEKITEMDFFDFFFSFGIVGLLLAIVALFKPAVRIVKAIWLRITRRKENSYLYSLLLSVILILGISFIAGHVIFAPGVSIYLVIGLALLSVLAEHETGAAEYETIDSVPGER
ncbi:O-antigen ligase family protein [Planococcus sp. CAU13]|uniref:O-antigen ligase family protein n=1 Tax=Planococcus sp. CAU13 TaxID=1541197 RepID=UPI0005300065|nr:O-antigen ligase family protein [Planococcus sp. CAU13]